MGIADEPESSLQPFEALVVVTVGNPGITIFGPC